MADASEFILGEFDRTLDERYRLSVPAELVQALGGEEVDLILAKERPGCLSLWNAGIWQQRLDAGVALVHGKMQAGRLQGRIADVQMFGRLLSTRHKTVQFSGRGRMLIPEGFREFLQVETGGNVTVLGAAVCVELWNPKLWLEYLSGRMPKFGRLFDQLSG